MSPVVAAVECRNYDREMVYSSVVRAITLAGGLPPLNGKKVLIKPNLLTHSKDCIERGVCTHPDVIYAVARYVIEQGGIPNIVDTPGGGLSSGIMSAVYRNCKISAIAEELNITLNTDIPYSEMENPSGKSVKNFLIINPVLESDVIISVCKLKTHVLTHYTGAIKNTFGVVPGLHKSRMHRRFQRLDDFSNMLIDLNEIVNPDFVIMDAIYGMEGDGPANGTPKNIGYVLASSSIYATDIVAQKMIGVDPFSVPTTVAAIQRNKVNTDDIVTVGDEIVPTSDFKMPHSYQAQPNWQPSKEDAGISYIIYFIRKKFSRCLEILGHSQRYKPLITPSLCIGCGKCLRHCPAHAIILENQKVHINHKLCIHCSGCDDICRNNAITRDNRVKGIGHITRLLRHHLYAFPSVIPEKCIGCSQCEKICSVDAVHIVDKIARFDTKKCIRCYCCHEMCNYSAIEIVSPAWIRLGRKVKRKLSAIFTAR